MKLQFGSNWRNGLETFMDFAWSCSFWTMAIQKYHNFYLLHSFNDINHFPIPARNSRGCQLHGHGKCRQIIDSCMRPRYTAQLLQSVLRQDQDGHTVLLCITSAMASKPAWCSSIFLLIWPPPFVRESLEPDLSPCWTNSLGAFRE